MSRPARIAFLLGAVGALFVAPASAENNASCADPASLNQQRSYQVVIPSAVDGAEISFQVIEPVEFDCENGHPLILHGHGFAQSRTTDRSGKIGKLSQAGYAVISIDQRGHGDSGGTVLVMDPDHEGRDVMQIVDWAEANLDYLAYRFEGEGDVPGAGNAGGVNRRPASSECAREQILCRGERVPRPENGVSEAQGANLLLGAIGGSYGGGYQLLLQNIDSKQRLDAIVPEITWHDLTYSLMPGGVPKSEWGLALAGAGDAGTQGRMDPILRSTLFEASVTGSFPEAALDYFYYHSPVYHCAGPRRDMFNPSGDNATYTTAPIAGLLPPMQVEPLNPSHVQTAARPVDAMFFQGVRDNLFNLNEAYRNYQCLRERGGDVRLLSYSTGHQILTPSQGLVIEGLESQSIPDQATCGDIDVGDAALAWFDEKLRGETGRVDSVVHTGRQICLALQPNDAVAVNEMPIGGEEFPVVLPGDAPVIARAGIGGTLPTVVPLKTIGDDGAVVAGIPTARLRLSYGGMGAEEYCQDETEPLMGSGTCDAILFFGLGVMRGDNPLPDLIEDQVMPVRGLGEHEIELVGVAERLGPGDQLFLVIYGQQQTYFGGGSRDPAAQLVQVEGSVQVPLLDNLPNIVE